MILSDELILPVSQLFQTQQVMTLHIRSHIALALTWDVTVATTLADSYVPASSVTVAAAAEAEPRN